jgi:hypothetical protein
MDSDYNCSCCGGELLYLGRLGGLYWYRCRDCGMEFSSTRERDACQ